MSEQWVTQTCKHKDNGVISTWSNKKLLSGPHRRSVSGHHNYSL